MVTKINIQKVSNVIGDEIIPEIYIDEVTGLIMLWLVDSYYLPAMEDYFLARIARWNGMYRSFAWLSSQSIEKMLKFNCLGFGLSILESGNFRANKNERTGHNYIPLFERLANVSDCLNWNLYEKIPKEELLFEIQGIKGPTIYKLKNGSKKTIYFSKCRPIELVEYFNVIGDTQNRYGAMAISTGFIDVLLLDALVSRLRSQFVTGGVNRDFRFVTQQGAEFFNKENYQFKIEDSVHCLSDGYSAHIGLSTSVESLHTDQSTSANYAKRWLRYRGALK
jgi:hypothetical protein